MLKTMVKTRNRVENNSIIGGNKVENSIDRDSVESNVLKKLASLRNSIVKLHSIFTSPRFSLTRKREMWEKTFNEIESIILLTKYKLKPENISEDEYRELHRKITQKELRIFKQLFGISEKEPLTTSIFLNNYHKLLVYLLNKLNNIYTNIAMALESEVVRNLTIYRARFYNALNRIQRLLKRVDPNLIEKKKELENDYKYILTRLHEFNVLDRDIYGEYRETMRKLKTIINLTLSIYRENSIKWRSILKQKNTLLLHGFIVNKIPIYSICTRENVDKNLEKEVVKYLIHCFFIETSTLLEKLANTVETMYKHYEQFSKDYREILLEKRYVI